MRSSWSTWSSLCGERRNSTYGRLRRCCFNLINISRVDVACGLPRFDAFAHQGSVPLPRHGHTAVIVPAPAHTCSSLLFASQHWVALLNAPTLPADFQRHARLRWNHHSELQRCFTASLPPASQCSCSRMLQATFVSSTSKRVLPFPYP
jgi:hypothetical protein